MIFVDLSLWRVISVYLSLWAINFGGIIYVDLSLWGILELFVDP
jgi:hypothetical protein